MCGCCREAPCTSAVSKPDFVNFLIFGHFYVFLRCSILSGSSSGVTGTLAAMPGGIQQFVYLPCQCLKNSFN